MYRVIQRVIQNCLLSKMVYLNVKYVIAIRSYELFYLYAESHWKCHTFEGYYTCSFSKLRHKAHQQVRKCSLTFPLKNDIVTFYENSTNKYVRVDKLGGWYPPSGYLGYIRYNFLTHLSPTLRKRNALFENCEKIQDCKIKHKFIYVLLTRCLLYLVVAYTILFVYVCYFFK